MDTKLYSLSSKFLPNGLTLDISHGYDFEVPYSQGNYNFLRYSFKHKNQYEVGVNVYLDELSMPTEIRSSISVSPCFEPYKRTDLPSNYIASVLKTLATFGYSAKYEDYDGAAVRLETLYKTEELETIMQTWLEQMDEARIDKNAH